MSNKPRFQSSNNRNNSKIKGVDVYYNNTVSALSATNVQEAIDEVYDLIGGALVSADNVTYDNSTSSLVSSNVQDAIDELDSNVSAIEPIAASDVTYDNGDSGLSATDVKGAIDELDSNHSAIPTTTVTEDQTGLESDRDNFANIWSDKTGPSLTTHVLATQRDDGDTFLGFYNRDYLSNIRTIENVRKSIIDLPSLILNHGGGAYKGSGINTGEEVGFAAYGTRNVRAEYRGLGTGGGSPATIINVDDTTGFASGDFICLSNIKEHVSLNSVFTQNAEGLYVVDSVDSATTLKVKAPASHTAFLCRSSVDLAFDPSNDNTYSSSAATAYVDQVEIGALFYRPSDQSFIYTHASNEADFLSNERFIATSASLTSAIGSSQYSILGSVSGNRNWTFKKLEEGTDISITDDGDALTISSSAGGAGGGSSSPAKSYIVTNNTVSTYNYWSYASTTVDSDNNWFDTNNSVIEAKPPAAGDFRVEFILYEAGDYLFEAFTNDIGLIAGNLEIEADGGTGVVLTNPDILGFPNTGYCAGKFNIPSVPPGGNRTISFFNTGPSSFDIRMVAITKL